MGTTAPAMPEGDRRVPLSYHEVTGALKAMEAVKRLSIFADAVSPPR